MQPLSTAEKAYVREWLALAEHDLRAAEEMLNNPGAFGYLTAFVAQQATEKLIKSALLAQGIIFPKSHDIPALLVLLSPHISFSPHNYASAAVLADYAVEIRYPGPKPNLAEVRTAVRIAQQFEQQIRLFVLAALL